MSYFVFETAAGLEAEILEYETKTKMTPRPLPSNSFELILLFSLNSLESKSVILSSQRLFRKLRVPFLDESQCGSQNHFYSKIS